MISKMTLLNSPENNLSWYGRSRSAHQNLSMQNGKIESHFIKKCLKVVYETLCKCQNKITFDSYHCQTIWQFEFITIIQYFSYTIQVEGL